MKGIVLCSGGLDSTLALLKLLKEGHEVVPMFVDYNQWSLEGEREAVDGIWAWLAIKGIYSNLGSVVSNKITWDGEWDEWKDERIGSVWGRNIALVGLAAMWAYTHGNDYDFIALGNHRGDVGPDCKPGLFDEDLDHTLRDATKSKIHLVLPIKELTIEDIGKELAKFGRELFELTYSCYWETPCGYRSPNDSYRCPGCRRKVLAMEAAAEGDSGLQEYFQQRLFRLPNCEGRTYQSPLAEEIGY